MIHDSCRCHVAMHWDKRKRLCFAKLQATNPVLAACRTSTAIRKFPTSMHRHVPQVTSMQQQLPRVDLPSPHLSSSLARNYKDSIASHGFMIMYNRIFMTIYSTIRFDCFCHLWMLHICDYFMIILVFCITTVVYFVIKLLIHYSWNSILIIWSYFPRMDFGTVQSVPQLKLL